MDTKEPVKRKRSSKNDYINNKTFSDACIKYADAAKAAKEQNEEPPQIPEYIGECFLHLAKKMSNRSNFHRYTYKEEMILDAVENCVKVVGNFDSTKQTRTGTPNAFSYFSQCIYWAFVRRINAENHQLKIKEKVINESSFSAFSDCDDSENGESVLNRIKTRSSFYQADFDEPFETKEQAISRASSWNLPKPNKTIKKKATYPKGNDTVDLFSV